MQLREALDELLVPDMSGPLDELTLVLQSAACSVARLRRHVDSASASSGSSVPVAELHAMDESFSRSIALTRELRERVYSRRPRGEYTSVTSVARDAVGRLQSLLPDSIALSFECPAGPAIVAAECPELRRVVVPLLEAAIAAVDGRGEIALEVSGPPPPSLRRRPSSIVIGVRCSAAIDPEHPLLVSLAGVAASLRARVEGLGGSLVFRADGCGGTSVSVTLPAA
jgi:hypothetical protein